MNFPAGPSAAPSNRDDAGRQPHYVVPHFQPLRSDVVALVERALAEDLAPLGDLTSTLLDPNLQAVGELRARVPGVLAGCMCVSETFAAVDPRLDLIWVCVDGDQIAAGDLVALVRGPLSTMLTAERTALNFLSHLSGIATTTAAWVERAAGRVQIWDTRKTLPGYRSLQKAAVRAGGGVNHRGNLSDMIMVKDNHLALGGITELVATARRRWPGRTVHVEVDRLDQLQIAIEAGADIVMLDNFTPAAIVEAMDQAEKWAAAVGRHRPLIEASGGITFDTLEDYAATGVDLVSSGAITNSSTILDLGLDVIADELA